VGFVYRPMTRFLNTGIIFGGAGIQTTTADGPLSTWATLFAATRWRWRLTTSRRDPDANWKWSDSF